MFAWRAGLYLKSFRARAASILCVHIVWVVFAPARTANKFLAHRAGQRAVAACRVDAALRTRVHVVRSDLGLALPALLFKNTNAWRLNRRRGSERGHADRVSLCVLASYFIKRSSISGKFCLDLVFTKKISIPSTLRGWFGLYFVCHGH